MLYTEQAWTLGHKLCGVVRTSTTRSCSYNPVGPVPVSFLFCFREAFPFLAATEDVTPFHEGVRLVNGHRQRHTIRGIVWENEEGPVPIVLIVHDKLTVLLETIRSYHRFIRTPFEIVIHDEGSTYEPLLAFLDMLRANGVQVFRVTPRPKSELQSQYPLGLIVQRVAQTVETVLKHTNASVYVVSDPDCALDSAPGYILDVYKRALDAIPGVNGVGASIRTDDVSKATLRAYPAWAEEGKVKQEYFLFGPVVVRYSRLPVDTTFCMYRRNLRFARMTGSIRLGPPFGVRHLDYYFESLDSAPPDVRLYLKKNLYGLSHATEYIKG